MSLLTQWALCCGVAAADAQHALEARVELRNLVQLAGRVKGGLLHAMRNSIPAQGICRQLKTCWTVPARTQPAICTRFGSLAGGR
jgi:hypothetical protein